MPRYAPYTTTVVGAHSVPRWYEALIGWSRWASSPRAISPTRSCARAQAAILEQEIAGIDVITGGEMHRRGTTGIRRRTRC